jgi:cytochrome c oxidase subunit IV
VPFRKRLRFVMTTSMAHADHTHAAHDHHDHGMGHAMPLSTLIAVFISLIGLTILTVYMSSIRLGSAEMFVSMGIATLKAILVAVYFMHMRHDKPLNILLVVFSLFFMTLFIAFTLVDSSEYQGQIEAAGPFVPAASPKQ